MSVRDILHHLEQVYGTQLSAETVSRITDQVLEEVRAWQSRPLDPVYAVVFLLACCDCENKSVLFRERSLTRAATDLVS